MKGGVRRVLGAGVLAFALTPAVAAAAPTRSQYIAQVEPVCNAYAQPEATTGNQALNDLFRGRGKKARRGFVSLGQLGDGEVRGIARVQPPAGDENLITAWLNSMNTEAGLVGRLAKPLKGFRPRNLGRFIQAIDLILGRVLPAEDYNTRFAAAYGFTSCATPLVPPPDEGPVPLRKAAAQARAHERNP